MNNHWFASISVGLEPVLQKELQSLGFDQTRIEPGGVSFYATWDTVQRFSPFLRTPSTLRLQLLRGKPVHKLSDLRHHLNAIEWSKYLTSGVLADVRVSCKRSKLNRSDIVTEKIERILRAILNSDSGPTLPFVVRIFENKLWLSAQLHSQLLHKRGWRTEQVRTPLRENWAAALLSIANWHPEEPLLDPFCGSGTILIEAARQAAQRPAHLRSPYEWRHWLPSVPTIIPEAMAVSARLFGSDRDAVSVAKAKRHAKSAGVDVSFTQADIRNVSAPTTSGLVIANPPYGIRSGRKTDAVHHWFGKRLQDDFQRWRVLFLSPSRHKARLVHPEAQRITQFSNGGIPVGVYAWDPLI